MKVKHLLLLPLMFGTLLYARTLTLQESIASTLAHHPDVKRFMLNIQQAEQGYNAAFSDYLPQLNLSATYNPTQTYVLPVNGTFHTVDDNGWNAGVSLHQKVWDFGKTGALVEASKIDEDISKLSLHEVKALLAFKVKSLYELMLVQKEAVKVREKDLEAKKAFYEQTLAMVKQGMKTHADANRFLSAVYVAEDSLAIAKAAYDKARNSLSLYMGKKIPEHVTLQAKALKKHVRVPHNIVTTVLAENTKLKMDHLSVNKSQQLHKSAHSVQFGSIDIVASHNRFSTLNTYNTDYVGVGYNVPLYTGGKLTAEEQKAKIAYQMAQEQRASDELAVREEVQNLLIDIRRYDKSIKAKRSQLKSAKSTQQKVEARYKEGLATYIEVLDNTAVMLNAELGVLEAYYLRALALDRIAYLKGEIR